MNGFKLIDGFIDFANIEFECPHCKNKFIDSKDFYSNRINKNKNCTTKVKCICEVKFGLTVDYKGDLVSFGLDKLNKI